MRTWRLSAGALAVVLLAGSAWWLVEDRAGSGRDCALVSTPLRDPGDALVPVEALLPSGTVGDQRRGLVEETDRVATELGLGRVVAGRFHEGATPSVVPLDAAVPGHVLLASPAPAGTDRPSLSAVDLGDGSTTWAREFSGVLPGGGLVGDDLVLLGSTGEGIPVVLTLDPGTGEVRRCEELGASVAPGTGRVLADQAGDRVVVVTGETGRPGEVALVAPVDGTQWSRPVDGLSDVATVTALGPDGPVLLGRFPRDPVRLVESGPVTGPQVQAVDLDAGEPAWTYPAEPTAEPIGAAAVAGVDPDTGISVLLTALPAGGGDGSDARMGLVALDAAGEVVWRRDLGRGFRTAELWGDLVAVGGRTRAGDLSLRGVGVADGGRRWQVTTPGSGASDRTALGAGLALGQEYAVPAPSGLVVVDPAAGTERTVRTDLPLDGLLRVGAHTVLRVGNAVLVVGAV